MNLFQAIVLGIVQGLTEFLPISSSGHLVIVAYLFRWAFPSDQIFVFNVLIQWGTLLAVIVYFYKDIWQILIAFFKGIFSGKPFKDVHARLGWYLLLATIPAGAFGLLLKSSVEKAFSSISFTCIFLLVTGVILIVSERIGKKDRELKTMGWLDAVWIGAWQAISIFPGLSRSGSTMAGGLTRNFDRRSAARFSFLMFIPIMLAAGILSLGDLFKLGNLGSFWPMLLVGFLVSAVVGFITIHLFLKLISRISFLGFAIYCLAAGGLVFTLSFFLAPLPSIPTNTYEPQVITVESTATVSWLGEKMNDCAQQLDSFSIEYNQTLAAYQDPKNTVILRWGEPGNLTGYTYEIGTDQLSIIVNPANPIQNISLDQLRAIYRGTQMTWSETGTSIAVWSPMQGEDIEQVFNEIALPFDQVTSLASLAPSPEALRSAVANDVGAIGVVTWNWVDETVKYIPITDVSTATLTMPVLAILAEEPQGAVYDWLSCMQTHP